MNKIKVVYSDKVSSDPHDVSPSAIKPKLFVNLLKNSEYKDDVEFVEPVPVSEIDFCRCHLHTYVYDVLTLKRPNGFGTYSQTVADSLPWTIGALYTASKLAIEGKYPTCAPVAGFHHAGFKGWEQLGFFCTFNGLMVTAMRLVVEGVCKKVAIVDCDMHWGNGTDDILDVVDPCRKRYLNLSFGKYFFNPSQADAYLDYFDTVFRELSKFMPDVILYQAGVDVHVNDPFGGVLTEDEMYERDLMMFAIAKDLGIPIVWNLAGGYQKDKDGGCNYVLQLHLNTVKACRKVYKNG